MPSEISTTKAEFPRDLKRLRNFYSASGNESQILYHLPQLASQDSFMSFMAEHNREIIGAASLLMNAEFAWFMGLRTHPNWRKRGVAMRRAPAEFQRLESTCGEETQL